MKFVKLALSLLVFVPAFTVFGLQGWGGDWYGGIVGGMIGTFFGAVFSGQFNGRWLDTFYPPETKDRDG